MPRNRRPDHYHVLVGMSGYMPDANYLAETRSQAEEIAKQEKRDYLEVLRIDEPTEDQPQVKAEGNAREGWYAIIRGGYTLPILITIDPCDDAACRNDAGELEEEF